MEHGFFGHANNILLFFYNYDDLSLDYDALPYCSTYCWCLTFSEFLWLHPKENILLGSQPPISSSVFEEHEIFVH